jgi:hypothetical protein
MPPPELVKAAKIKVLPNHEQQDLKMLDSKVLMMLDSKFLGMVAHQILRQ